MDGEDNIIDVAEAGGGVPVSVVPASAPVQHGIEVPRDEAGGCPTEEVADQAVCKRARTGGGDAEAAPSKTTGGCEEQ